MFLVVTVTTVIIFVVLNPYSTTSSGMQQLPNGYVFATLKRRSLTNTAQLSIGTAMHSGSKHRKTGREFCYPSRATSKYPWVVIAHHITHAIFNNTVTITKMYQVTALSCRFWRKCNFACKRPNSKMKMLIVRCTRNQMSWTLHHRTRESLLVLTMMIC